MIERVCDSQQSVRHPLFWTSIMKLLVVNYEVVNCCVLKARVSPEKMPVLITTSGNCLPGGRRVLLLMWC